MLGRIVKTRDGELHIAFRDKVAIIHITKSGQEKEDSMHRYIHVPACKHS